MPDERWAATREMFASFERAESVWIADTPDLADEKERAFRRFHLGMAIASIIEGGNEGVIVRPCPGDDGTPGWELRAVDIHVLETHAKEVPDA